MFIKGMLIMPDPVDQVDVVFTGNHPRGSKLTPDPVVTWTCNTSSVLGEDTPDHFTVTMLPVDGMIDGENVTEAPAASAVATRARNETMGNDMA